MRLYGSFLTAALAFAALFSMNLRAQSALPPEVAQHGYADLIIVNGKIVSMDDTGRNTNPGNICLGDG